MGSFGVLEFLLYALWAGLVIFYGGRRDATAENPPLALMLTAVMSGPL